ncbi:MAG: molybdate ABC transporter substrate-binding protein [Methanoregula sp.]|nr:molybdate ABC transporter substrate-binding protein [Methanoregula sp.]
MKETLKPYRIVLISIVCGLLLASALFAGCTQSTTSTPATPVATTAPVTTQAATPVATATAVPTTVVTTATPAPTYTASSGNLVAFTAASLTGASGTLGTSFTNAYPGHKVVFNLDGTQALKTQVENGAYADVFISASNSYTNTLKSEGYFVNSSVKTLCTNYVIVILPASNPGNIQSLSDLSKPGVKIAMAASTVPVGTASLAAISNLANSTYGQEWKNSTISNVVTYETSEPAVATKVSLGEVDAGFVYQSTATAAATGTYQTLTISKKDNYLQTYSIGILQESTNKAVAAEFEQFMLSSAGQDILQEYGFTPVI